jgi:riboflavin kinase
MPSGPLYRTMSMATEGAVGTDELATLKLLALDGALESDTKISCANLAADLDASNQTASRRLQHLDDAGFLARETVADGQWVAVTETGERALYEEYADYRRLFEENTTVELNGTVTSGMGEGRHYISLPGYMAQFEERLGYEPFPGTLNVSLAAESTRARTALDAATPVEIDGWEDDERTYGPAFCYPATVLSDEEEYDRAHVIAPERTHHDEDQLELIAPAKLRDELELDDGDSIAVYIGVEP